ncbi:MAG: hypothetical protein IJ550_07495 [Bacteroidaceae bacterium]|nr:hypothetical protein [Bacteroidaceae bacterium]
MNTYEENQKKNSGSKDNPDMYEISDMSISQNENAVLRKHDTAASTGNNVNKYITILY